MFDYFTNKLTGNKLVGARLFTLLKQKITNYYIKLQVYEISRVVSIGNELHVFMD